jgi:hypothetical protein
LPKFSAKQGLGSPYPRRNKSLVEALGVSCSDAKKQGAPRCVNY